MQTIFMVPEAMLEIMIIMIIINIIKDFQKAWNNSLFKMLNVGAQKIAWR